MILLDANPLNKGADVNMVMKPPPLPLHGYRDCQWNHNIGHIKTNEIETKN